MVLLAVLSDDEPATSNEIYPFDGHHENMPHGTCTPPTPPSRSPPPASLRIRAVAQLQPVSIPDIVRDMAGKNPQQKLADFDRHHMPDGVPEPDVLIIRFISIISNISIITIFCICCIGTTAYRAHIGGGWRPAWWFRCP